jgi:glucokinase
MRVTILEKNILIGVDLGGTTTKMALIHHDGEIFHKWEIPTDVSNNGNNILDDIAKSIEEKLTYFKTSKESVKGIGMGAPGPVNLETGVIYEAVNLGWKDNYPLAEKLGSLTGLPVVVDNDANCAAIGEMWMGAGLGSKNLVCVTLGTGVGGGVIVNGDIVHGIKGAAGEIGHITVKPENGYLCNCGNTGCLETIASATGIVRAAVDKMKETKASSVLNDVIDEKGGVSSKLIFDSARDGDSLAKEIIDEITSYLGLALANVGNVLNPEYIVIGGGVSAAGEILLKPLQYHFEKFAFTTVAKSTKLVLATLGNDAGVIGAAWLVKNKL